MNHPHLVLMAVAMIAAPCWADPDTPPTNRVAHLTLDQALALAEASHPDLAALQAEALAASARARQAGAFPNPEAIAKVESAPFNGRTTGDAEYLVGLEQAIPLGKRLGKARAAEQALHDSLLHQGNQRRAELRRSVHGAFAQALYQESAHRLRQSIARDARTLTNLVSLRVQGGDATAADLALAELELSRAEIEERRATALRDQSHAALAAALGRPSLQIDSLDGTLESAFEVPAIESIAADLRGHPVLAAADAEVRAGEARLDLARAQRIPDLKVELLYRRIQEEDRNAFDAGLSLPLPVFQGNRRTVDAARAGLDAAEARRRSTRVVLESRQREARLHLEAALAAAREWSHTVLPKSDTVRRAYEDRYQAGDIGLAELLPVRRDDTEARLSHQESLRDVMQAWAELKSALGLD